MTTSFFFERPIYREEAAFSRNRGTLDSLLIYGGQDPKLTAFLAKMGYDIVECQQLSEAISATSTNHFDLILVDSRLDVDGVDVCEYFRSQEQTRQTPLVFLAEDRDSELAAREHLAQVEFITAPYRVGSVVSKIATCLRLRKFRGADEGSASIGEINSRLRELNERFTRQLEEARELQNSLIPSNLPADERYDVAVCYEPLEEVGGDWFYVHETPDNRLAVQIADVTGHGLSAAFIGSMTKLAMIAADKCAPDELLQEMNRLMEPNIPPGKFVTMFSYVFDPASGALEYARAGHPPGLLLNRSAGEVKQLKGDGFAIGFFEDSLYTPNSAQLEVGDVLLVFTDAIPESQNLEGQTYDYDRAAEILKSSNRDSSAAEMLQAVFDDFNQFRDGRIVKDDVTAIVLKRVK